MNPNSLLFTEKYRPQHVKDVVGDCKNIILDFLKTPESMPHLLFISKSPGSGKSSLMRAIINDLDCDFLLLNSSNDRSIETVRQKIKEFCSSQSSRSGKRRAVCLDEADGLTKQAMDSLRNIMETYAHNAIFILTANNINKISEPIQSRCITINFSYPKKEEVAEYIKMICDKENIQFTEKGVEKIIQLNYPSIRNMVLSLQQLSAEEKPLTEDSVHPANYLFQQYWELLKKMEWKPIKQSIMESSIDPRDLNDYFWNKALEESNIKIIQITCRNEKDISVGADPKIIVITSLLEMVK